MAWPGRVKWHRIPFQLNGIELKIADFAKAAEELKWHPTGNQRKKMHPEELKWHPEELKWNSTGNGRKSHGTVRLVENGIQLENGAQDSILEELSDAI